MRIEQNIIEQIKQIPIERYLQHIGAQQNGTGINRKYYCANVVRPEADDKRNLVVYTHTNTWCDQKTNEGGDIFNLVAAVNGLDAKRDFRKVVQILQEAFGQIEKEEDGSICGRMPQGANSPSSNSPYVPQDAAGCSPSSSSIRQITLTSHTPLWRDKSYAYLANRGLQGAWMANYLQEVNYTVTDDEGKEKQLYGLGWQNDKGGWNIRMKIETGGKTCIAPQGITTINANKDVLCIFEGMFDFLSFCAYYGTNDKRFLSRDTLPVACIILNSCANKKMLDNVCSNYTEIHCFMDNDEEGTKTTDYIRSLHKKVKDHRDVYAGYNDFNDYLKAKNNQEKECEQQEEEFEQQEEFIYSSDSDYKMQVLKTQIPELIQLLEENLPIEKRKLVYEKLFAFIEKSVSNLGDKLIKHIQSGQQEEFIYLTYSDYETKVLKTRIPELIQLLQEYLPIEKRKLVYEKLFAFIKEQLYNLGNELAKQLKNEEYETE